MVRFDLWIEGLIFVLIFGMIVLIPCVFIAIFGRKLIDQLGRYPSKAARIHMKALVPVVITEIAAFLFLIGFYLVISNLRIKG